MKSKLMGILALASCVMLAGCGKNSGSEDPKDDPVGPAPEPVSAVIEIKDFPSDIAVGEEIELADYIDVSGGKDGETFSLDFDDESFLKISLLSDTKLLCEEKGNVNFTVNYGGERKDGSFVIGSALLKNFTNGIKNAGYDYGIIYQDYDYDYYHWENYGEKYMIDKFFDGENFGGFIEGPEDGRVYSYIIDDDDQFVFSISGNEPEYIRDYSKPLVLPTSGYTVKEEGTGSKKSEYLSIEENDEGVVKNICIDFFDFSAENIEYILAANKIKLTAFEVEETVFTYGKETIPVYMAYALITGADESSIYWGKEVYLDAKGITFDKDLLFRDDAEAYIESGEQPKSSFTLDVQQIADAINKHNYQIDYSYNWYEATISKDGKNVTRGKAVGYNPFIDPADMDKEGQYIVDFYNACGSFSAYMSEDKTFSDLPHAGGIGMINRFNGVENVAYEYSEQQDGTYKAKKEDLAASIYDPYNDDMYINYQFMTGAVIGEWPSVYSKFFINSGSESATENVYHLSGGSCEDFFICLCYDAVPDSLYPEDYIIGNFNTLPNVAGFMYEQDEIRTFDVVVTEKLSGGELTELIFDFSLVQAHENNLGQIDAYYQYAITVSFNFNDCDMPEFDVVFQD